MRLAASCCVSLVLVLVVLGEAQGQPGVSPGLSEDFTRAVSGFHYSLSRQFVIHGQQTRAGWLAVAGQSTNAVRLEPDLLSVSCERIKQAFLKELGVAKDEWRGTISLELHPARSLDEVIPVVATHFQDGWRYHVELPDAIERPRLIRSVVEVLLLEMANRNSSGRSAEIPAWLAQGVAQQVMQGVMIDISKARQVLAGSAVGQLSLQDELNDSLVLDPKVGSIVDGVSAASVRTRTVLNPLTRAHQELTQMQPLTLEELSWPEDDQFAGAAGDRYRSSAQLLFCRLGLLPDGRECLRRFVSELPQHYNWQMAFFKAFHEHFATQRDWEKWWTLEVQSFVARDLAHTWSEEESWHKLDAIIRPPVEVRTAANELPLHTQVRLQTIIRDWEFLRQNKVLQEKIQQLNLLRARVAPGLAPLVDDYRQVLQDYFKKRNQVAVPKLSGRTVTAQLDKIIAGTLHELDSLDARLAQMRPSEEPVSRTQQDTASVLGSH